MKRIYLYLFVFSLAINVFQYVSASKMLEEKTTEIENLHQKVETQKDSINKLNQKLQITIPS